jgi:hypothetical protein
MISRLVISCALLCVLSSLPGWGSSEPTAADNGTPPTPAAETNAPKSKMATMMAPKTGEGEK